MRLQRSISRRLRGKEYVKYQIVIPNSAVVQLGWSPGDQLESGVNSKGLLVYKVEPTQKNKRPDYKQFKEAVTSVLMSLRQGCTWSELRLKAGLHQKTPSPTWVERMENENILERIRDSVTSQVTWRLPEEYFRSFCREILNGYMTRTGGTD